MADPNYESKHFMYSVNKYKAARQSKLVVSPVWVSFVQGCGRQDTPLVCMYGLQRIDLFLICLGAGGFTMTCCLYMTGDVFADCGMAILLLLTWNRRKLRSPLEKNITMDCNIPFFKYAGNIQLHCHQCFTTDMSNQWPMGCMSLILILLVAWETFQNKLWIRP